MFSAAFRKIFGTRNDRELKRLWPLVGEINDLETGIAALDDEGIRGRIGEIRAEIAGGRALDDALVPVFALVREASRRVLGMRHFDAQLLGGIMLHRGCIAEMKTGEGKTLVATAPVVLNALSGKGVHVVTVNDYLARRDAAWMGRLYNFLGLSVGVVLHGLDDRQRQEAYGADITYGQNNEFGFDYLRDNMKFSLDQLVQRELNYAIVDEVDSILVDEARTPLIISGPAEESTETYAVVDRIVPRLERGRLVEKGEEEEGDYAVDEKHRSIVLTEEGVAHAEKLLGIDNLYDMEHQESLHHLQQALRAHALFKRDVEYVVRDGEIIIVDEFTGRMMPGRRWSDGLHQAVEAKEGLKVQQENQTLATVTFQNYFRMYGKLAGMTGTADTEAVEFRKIYDLEVSVLPTHRPMIRRDDPDVVYKTEAEKFEAVLDEIAEANEKGQPVLVGTISIEKSERLAGLLRTRGIRHHVLNAKNHGREAEIIAQAGRFGAVTISTNMAGRGTDIVLGGNPEGLAAAQLGPREPDDAELLLAVERFRIECTAERERVIEAGGLHIVGTERHESRRIDNQLRGRAGRQGDPGSSRFFLSLEDDLLRIFQADRIKGLMERLGMEEGEPIEHAMVTRAIANAQSRVEGQNFDTRKHLLEYDDVMNKQREVVYHRRLEALRGDDLREELFGWMDELASRVVETAVEPGVAAANWDWASIEAATVDRLGIAVRFADEERAGLTAEALVEILADTARRVHAEREERYGAATMRQVERAIALQIIDQQWKDHLRSMDKLKEGVGLRGYGQQNPLTVYQKEGFELFRDMMERAEAETMRRLLTVQLVTQEEVEATEARRRAEQERRAASMRLMHDSATSQAPPQRPPVSTAAAETRVGRNDPCPCGSGRKYKRCHGQ